MEKCDVCNRRLMYQPSLWGDGYHICPLGHTEKPSSKREKPIKSVDYKSLQDQFYKYKEKAIELDKRIKQHGEDPRLIEERMWCRWVQKQIRPKLGLLGFTQEDYMF